MNRLLNLLTLVLALLLIIGFSRPAATIAQAQTATARCNVKIPAEWGAFKGASDQFGLVFEDSSGTIRTVTQMPCGLDNAPNLALEARRK
jgi:hypothetical protein